MQAFSFQIFTLAIVLFNAFLQFGAFSSLTGLPLRIKKDKMKGVIVRYVAIINPLSISRL
jgi:hypothetical protein